MACEKGEKQEMNKNKTASLKVTIFPTQDQHGKVRTSSLVVVVEGSCGGGQGGGSHSHGNGKGGGASGNQGQWQCQYQWLWWLSWLWSCP